MTNKDKTEIITVKKKYSIICIILLLFLMSMVLVSSALYTKQWKKFSNDNNAVFTVNTFFKLFHLSYLLLESLAYDSSKSADSPNFYI